MQEVFAPSFRKFMLKIVGSWYDPKTYNQNRLKQTRILRKSILISGTKIRIFQSFKS